MDTKKPCVKDLTIDEIREEMLLSKTAFERRKKFNSNHIYGR